MFRDEDVAYATALWASGVQTELHVWPGGFHGFEQIAPHLPMSKAALKCRREWVGRRLSR
ncbi:alpha/beta hydrolase [Streptomyces scopuliridis]|uniref:alpha/beta hydrolase n=1 Tax=Streptomyces scopuliridis TaxID=452529 RepID=UPI00369302EE